MAKTVVFDHLTINSVQIYPVTGGGYVVRVEYVTHNAGETEAANKSLVRYSSTATGTPKLPAGMETKLNELLTAFGNGLTQLEGM